MPYPGGPRVRFLVLAGLVFFKELPRRFPRRSINYFPPLKAPSVIWPLAIVLASWRYVPVVYIQL